MSFTRTGPMAVMCVSPDGAPIAARLAGALGATLHAPRALHPDARVYEGSLGSLLGGMWEGHAGIVGVMAGGILVRAIAPHVRDKHTDPAVVCVDDAGRFAISLLSGHEGGANALAEDVAGLLGATAVVTTGTEARKRVIAGVGSRAGVGADAVLEALDAALAEAGRGRADVRGLATLDAKASEPGIVAAAEALGVPLHVVDRAPVRALTDAVRDPTLAEEAVGVAAVAVPASLLSAAGARPLLARRAGRGVTIALAEDGAAGEGAA